MAEMDFYQRRTTWKVSVCSFRSFPFSSYGLNVNELALPRALPEGLNPLQLAAVEREAGPGGQLEEGTGDRHQHQHVEAAQPQRRRPQASGSVRHRNQGILHRLLLKNIITCKEHKGCSWTKGCTQTLLDQLWLELYTQTLIVAITTTKRFERFWISTCVNTEQPGAD